MLYEPIATAGTKLKTARGNPVEVQTLSSSPTILDTKTPLSSRLEAFYLLKLFQDVTETFGGFFEEGREASQHTPVLPNVYEGYFPQSPFALRLAI